MSSIIMTPMIFFSAYALDLIVGDPRWCPHPVVVMGKGISCLERVIRAYFSCGHLKTGGVILWFVVILITCFVTWGILMAFSKVHWMLGFVVTVILASQTLAVRSLFQESKVVFDHLNAGSIEGARKGLAMIVGRDTENLDEEGILRAVVETVSENLSDGVIAPMFYLLMGGVPLAMTYKAVNTLDSMIGYKSDRYRDIGYFSARMDDIFNWIPARMTGFIVVIASFLLGLNGKNAWRIMRRDCRNHPSPNSGIPEAAVAGALGVELAGPMSYFGKMMEKPTIGDQIRLINIRDIKMVWAIMFCSSALMSLFCITMLRCMVL
jgi:adenosylcobinamide-phosphate synthase